MSLPASNPAESFAASAAGLYGSPVHSSEPPGGADHARIAVGEEIEGP
jgi:hypothetical protein